MPVGTQAPNKYAMRFLRTRSLQLVTDALVVAVALSLAYSMRFEGYPPRLYVKQLLLVLPYVIILRLISFWLFGVYRLIWRYISLRDLPRILLATGTGSGVIVAARFSAEPIFSLMGLNLNPIYATVPYGVLAIEMVLTILGLVAVRGLWRLITEREKRLLHEEPGLRKVKERALLIGAGDAGVMVAKELKANPEVGFEVVGFVDDDPNKLGTIIQGTRVVGTTSELERNARKLNAEVAVITMVNVPSAAVRRIVDAAEAARLRVQIIPGLYEILSGKVAISKIRDVAIEDLLGRAPVHLEEQAIKEFLTHKTVLVSGAGGSIGSEMCRQVCRYKPRLLVLLDQAENPLFHINRELQAGFEGVAIVPVVGSVVDRLRMQQVMARYRPDVVFHAAAHKHVPLMELNPSEAIKNNILGSRNMAELADEYGAAAFVMISTDKAVNPTSMMGASKRLAEMYVQALSTRSSTRFITVRFGNVLGSEGSVVPIFKEQIARGGPVMVTHPDMKRYFMTIPEASQLVLEAGTMGDGGEIFILEMGEPISIVTLARDLIKLSGFTSDEIKIEFSGIRPGEKLYEEINLDEENATKTKHPRIWVGKSRTADLDHLAELVDDLVALAPDAESEALKVELARHVPEYHPTQKGRIEARTRQSGSTEDDAVEADAALEDSVVGEVTM